MTDPGVGNLKGISGLAGLLGADEFRVCGTISEGGAIKLVGPGRETGPKGCTRVTLGMLALDVLEGPEPMLTKPPLVLVV